MLTQEHYDHYWNRGWVSIPSVFTQEEAMNLSERVTYLSYAELYSSGKPTYTTDVGPDGWMAPRKIEMPSRRYADCLEVLFDRRLQSIVTSLLGSQPILIRDQVFMKPPRIGSEKPFHQDLAHFNCEPADGILAAWIALDDAFVDNGCLRYIDFSHRGSLLHHEKVSGAEYDLSPSQNLISRQSETPAIVRRGSVVLHHSLVLHTSGPNLTEHWRRAYSSHWVTDQVIAHDNTFDVMYVRHPGTLCNISITQGGKP
ncbi:MAG: phytanoyl-CoA dioxygenase family protein [Symploca sp. SIO1A3]|nr:phytanoyl-CoA dioxygenase family protein [Symploca sp. SIO1A3]